MCKPVKVFFPLEEPSEGGSSGEWLWTVPAGESEFVVDNSPFEVYEISYRDVISAEKRDDVLTFASLIRRGGHSTYRIRLRDDAIHADFLKIWPPFAAHNCTYEGSSDGRLYTIDVPPEADIFAVYALLEDGEKKNDFDFEEAHYCRPEERPS